MLRTFGALCLISAAATLTAAEATLPGGYTPAERRHWSFRPRSQPEIPQFTGAADRAWAKDPIDAFILERLKKTGLQPAPKADRVTLIRRVTFDVTGLPPAPAEIDAFVKDRSPRAYEKVVDRLLASPHYGERWGQHWLDLVRYAETDGFEYDTHRHDAWRYRDYVIRSFNDDKPYNQFVREQLAGDEISAAEQASPDTAYIRQLEIASGFNRLGPLRKNAGNQDVASSRNESLTEMTNIVGSAFLGVTLGCARCHDHKFDPIRQKDYYRIQAYFAATEPQDVPLATAGEEAQWKAKVDAIDAKIKALKKEMTKLDAAAKKQMEKRIEEMEDAKPEPLPSLFSVKDDPAKATEIHVLARGDSNNKGDRVSMRPLGVLLPDKTPELPQDTDAPRTKLVDWIVSPDNPLTARVIVNRIWQNHFGRGIVATPNDFGRMGERPSHPELLDYLANEFAAGGWQFKPLHKQILMTNAYQQSGSSPTEPKARQADPDNKLLWHYARRRLEAEEIRDAELAVAGKLNLKAGGPSVIVPVDPEMLKLLYKPSQWKVTADENEHNRRSIYLIAKRNLHVPMMEVFDAPDFALSCPRRESSTAPPQALELLNGDFSNRMAESLAARLQKEAGKSRAKQVDLAYRLAAGRHPTVKEKQIALAFLKTQPLREFALAVLNLNALLYVE